MSRYGVLYHGKMMALSGTEGRSLKLSEERAMSDMYVKQCIYKQTDVTRYSISMHSACLRHIRSKGFARDTMYDIHCGIINLSMDMYIAPSLYFLHPHFIPINPKALDGWWKEHELDTTGTTLVDRSVRVECMLEIDSLQCIAMLTSMVGCRYTPTDTAASSSIDGRTDEWMNDRHGLYPYGTQH
ncbi:hypothetical protein CBL_07902 [Carabus blaptoides fortunei]